MTATPPTTPPPAPAGPAWRWRTELPTAGIPDTLPRTAPDAGPRPWWSAGRTVGWPLAWLLGAAVAVVPVTRSSLAAGALILLGGLCAVVADRDPRIPSGEGAARRVGLLAVTTVTGLGAVALDPRGLGYVPVFVAATILARVVLDTRVIWAFTAAAGVALSVVLVLVTASPWVLLAGLGVPAVASRRLDRSRLRREHVRVVALLAERDALRETELAAAAAEERARIARDLHDVLAHTLSGLSLHLQGIRAVLAKHGPGGDDPVIGQVDRAADLARAGLAEAKDAVAALRADPDDAPGAAPSSSDIEELVAAHGAVLDPAADPRAAALDRAAGRVRATVFATVREGLTNCGRHASGARVTVAVAREDDEIVAAVIDDGGTTALDDVGGGQGVAGLVERAALVGGSVTAGPYGDGWRVELRVPASGRASTGGAAR